MHGFEKITHVKIKITIDILGKYCIIHYADEIGKVRRLFFLSSANESIFPFPFVYHALMR